MVHITSLNESVAQQAGPGLRYHKFHSYDALVGDGAFKTSSSSSTFLDAIASACSGHEIEQAYCRFYERYTSHIDSIEHAQMLSVTMDWRTIVGWGTNPALESGIALHPVLGVPIVPGSSTKGLVHQYAECALIDGDYAIPQAPPERPDEPPQKLLSAIEYGLKIRRLFGSLCLENMKDSKGSLTPRERFAAWLKLTNAQCNEAWQSQAEKIRCLLSEEGTGGRLRFYDAILAKKSFESNRPPLEVDILNVHYRDYYGDAQKPYNKDSGKPDQRALPTDDTNPVPIKFLALRAGVDLEFRFRYAPYRARKDDNESAAADWADFEGYDAEEILNLVDSWMIGALTERGIGAKTAAGYGYAKVELGGIAAMRIDDPSKLADLIDKAIRDKDDDYSTELAAGIWADSDALAVIDGWRGKIKPAIKKRMAWFDALPKPGGSSGATRTDTVKVRQIAPAMIGGADADKNDSLPSLRPPSIRGHVRFWTRALAGLRCREVEAELWGSTDVGQRVSLVGASPTEAERKFVAGFALPLPMLPPGKDHELRWRVPAVVADDNKLRSQLGAVLWTWLHLGGLGRRSRRGYGSLLWQPGNDDLIGNWLSNDHPSPYSTRDALVRYLRDGLTQALGDFDCDNVTAAREPWPFFRLHSLDQVFVGKTINNEYAEKKGQGQTVLQDLIKGVRHAPPKKMRSDVHSEQRQLGYVIEGSDKRLASPMLWRVFKLDNGHYVPVMTWSPHIEPNETADSIVRLNPGTPMYEHLTDTLGFTESLAGGSLHAPANQ